MLQTVWFLKQMLRWQGSLFCFSEECSIKEIVHNFKKTWYAMIRFANNVSWTLILVLCCRHLFPSACSLCCCKKCSPKNNQVWPSPLIWPFDPWINIIYCFLFCVWIFLLTYMTTCYLHVNAIFLFLWYVCNSAFYKGDLSTLFIQHPTHSRWLSTNLLWVSFYRLLWFSTYQFS